MDLPYALYSGCEVSRKNLDAASKSKELFQFYLLPLVFKKSFSRTDITPPIAIQHQAYRPVNEVNDTFLTITLLRSIEKIVTAMPLPSTSYHQCHMCKSSCSMLCRARVTNWHEHP